MYSMEGFDLGEVVRRILKYLVEGLAIAVAAKLLPKQKLSLNEIVMLGVIAAAVFAVLDLYAPAVGGMARTGAGFGIGGGLVGFPGN